jgi:hypothetical protein
MKDFSIAAATIFLCLIMNACTKSASDTLTGFWHIVSDSTITTGPSVSYNIFHGSEDDYFSFSPDGSLYIKEGSSTSTNSYQIIAADTLLLPGIGFSVNGVTEPSIFKIANGRLRIVVNAPGNIITPGHQYQRIINLKR